MPLRLDTVHIMNTFASGCNSNGWNIGCWQNTHLANLSDIISVQGQPLIGGSHYLNNEVYLLGIANRASGLMEDNEEAGRTPASSLNKQYCCCDYSSPLVVPAPVLA